MGTRAICRVCTTLGIGLAIVAGLGGCREQSEPSGLAGPSENVQPPPPGPTSPPGYTTEQIAYEMDRHVRSRRMRARLCMPAHGLDRRSAGPA
jgi:hypothetical protein